MLSLFGALHLCTLTGVRACVQPPTTHLPARVGSILDDLGLRPCSMCSPACVSLPGPCRSRPGTEEALQRAAAILTTDLRVELLLELPGLADTQQELRAQWQAVGLLLVRILRSAPSLLTPAAHELLDSVQMLALGLGPTSGAPNRLDNLPILQEAAPLLVRLAQEPQGGE